MMRILKAHPWLAGLVGVLVTVGVVLPVYASCGKCSASGKDQASVLAQSKMTLAAATTLAEIKTKGTAVRAAVHMHEGASFVEVHCMVGDKIQSVEIEIATGKILKSTEVASLETHSWGEPTEAVASPRPTETPTPQATPDKIAEANSLLKKATTATEAGRLAESESLLSKLQGMKGMLPGDLKQQIDAAQSAYEIAKAAKSVMPSGQK